MTPSTDQVVFEGDSLTLTCRISPYEGQMKVVWLRNGNSVVSSRSLIQQDRIRSRNFAEAEVVLDPLSPSDSGAWRCSVQAGGRRFSSRSVTVTVVAKDSKSCPPTTTRTPAEETLHWPRTLPGITRQLPCASSSSSPGRQAAAATGAPPVHLAYLRCSETGRWVYHDRTGCRSTNQIGRDFENFAKVQRSFVGIGVARSGRRGCSPHSGLDLHKICL